MKTIKIRYVKYKDTYRIEHKGWFRWKPIAEYVTFYGGELWYYYTVNGENELITKSKLLEIVLRNYYKIDKRLVKIIEYPMIEIHEL